MPKDSIEAALRTEAFDHRCSTYYLLADQIVEARFEKRRSSAGISVPSTPVPAYYLTPSTPMNNSQRMTPETPQTPTVPLTPSASGLSLSGSSIL